MKRITLLIAATILMPGAALCQQSQQAGLFTIGAEYRHEFVLDGYVRVREWDLVGDKMTLKDLGMRRYPALQLHGTKHLSNGRSLSLFYDHYFMTGRSTFNRNIVYNGTIINGRKGIDVSPTRYFRISAMYNAPLLIRPGFDVQYTIGFVFDHITFYLDGEVDPSSKKTEVLEGFGRQAFPFPAAGLKGTFLLNAKQKVHWQTSGTYVPEFKSFYTEGGNVRLQYSNFQLGLEYSRTVSDFEIGIGTKMQYMHLFQESREDTNVITTLTAGPFLGVIYHF